MSDFDSNLTVEFGILLDKAFKDVMGVYMECTWNEVLDSIQY